MVRTPRLLFLSFLLSSGLHSNEPATGVFLIAIIPAPSNAQDPPCQRQLLRHSQRAQSVALEVDMRDFRAFRWGSGPSADTAGWNTRDLPMLLQSTDVHLDLADFGNFDQIKIIASGLPGGSPRGDDDHPCREEP